MCNGTDRFEAMYEEDMSKQFRGGYVSERTWALSRIAIEFEGVTMPAPEDTTSYLAA